MLTHLGAFLLPAVPLLVLLALLLLGRFPGERAIERLAQRIAARGRRAARREPGANPATRPASWAPGGGELIALGLARRPPPGLSLTC
jgi:hypothetical protein